jgi:outer membrane lipoprotein-sorting protein
MKKIIKIILIVSMFFYTAVAFAITGVEVMRSVKKEEVKHVRQKMIVNMLVKNKEGQQKESYFNFWQKKTKGQTSSLIKLFKPAYAKGLGLLTKNKAAGKSEQWLYDPDSKITKRLEPGEKKERFFNSDYTYEDLAGRVLNRDIHKLTKTDEKYYYITSVPKAKNDSYSKLEYIIDKKKMLPRKIIFYDKDGKKLKTLLNKKMVKIESVYMVVESIVNDHQTGSSTLLDVREVNVKLAIPDTLVDQKGLQAE